MANLTECKSSLNRLVLDIADVKLYVPVPPNVSVEMVGLLDYMLAAIATYDMEYYLPSESSSDEGFTYSEHMGGSFELLCDQLGIAWQAKTWDEFNANVKQVYDEGEDGGA